MTKKHAIEWLDPSVFTQHPQHKKSFLPPDQKKKKETYKSSIERYGKLKPVFYIRVGNDKLVIDGWAYISYALETGLKTVRAQEVDASTEEEINDVMLQLQSSDHSSPAEEFLIYSAAFEIHSKGKGFRSDIVEDPASTDIAGGTRASGRRPTVYDKIAANTNAPSAKRVQYVLKVGKVNPLFFERMENDRMSLHTAYLNCTSEEKGEMPASPSVKAAVPTSGIPVPTAVVTGSVPPTRAPNNPPPVPAANPRIVTQNDTTTYEGICDHCGNTVKLVIKN